VYFAHRPFGSRRCQLKSSTVDGLLPSRAVEVTDEVTDLRIVDLIWLRSLIEHELIMIGHRILIIDILSVFFGLILHD